MFALTLVSVIILVVVLNFVIIFIIAVGALEDSRALLEGIVQLKANPRTCRKEALREGSCSNYSVLCHVGSAAADFDSAASAGRLCAGFAWYT